jgi:hypothetical protein
MADGCGGSMLRVFGTILKVVDIINSVKVTLILLVFIINTYSYSICLRSMFTNSNVCFDHELITRHCNINEVHLC